MVVKHDYVHQTLTFTPPDEYRYTGSGTVLAIERPRQIPMIQATLDSIPGAFGIDTGARSALLLYGPCCEQNRLAAKYGARLEWRRPLQSAASRSRRTRLRRGGVRARGGVARPASVVYSIS
jgi:hypothetical protein